MKPAYIIYPEEVQELHVENTSNGIYYFIKTLNSLKINSYRRLETATGYYYVQVKLPQYLIRELVHSGRVYSFFK